MRSNLSKSEFFLKSNRKPKQQALLDQIDSLTLEDINKCGQPKWVREALTELKSRGGMTAKMSAIALADQMQAAHIQAPMKKSLVYEWTGMTIEIKPEGRGMSLDLQTNDLFLCDAETQEIKIDYSIVRTNCATINSVVSRAKLIGSYTDRDYIELVGQRKQRS